jgi:hypothetical protein
MLHKSSPVNRLNISFAASCLALAFLGFGCRATPVDEMTTAVVSGERPVAMEGSEAFFGGKVSAKVTVSRGVGSGLKQGKGGGHDRASAGDKATYSAYVNSDSKQVLGNPLPPVTLHLVLTNAGTEEVAVKMIDFDSDLGNFVVDPDTVTIPPGRTAEPTPMVSQLGVSSDEISFKVRLQLGKASETRTVVVRNVLDESGKPKPGAGQRAVSP